MLEAKTVVMGLRRGRSSGTGGGGGFDDEFRSWSSDSIVFRLFI